MTRQIPVLRTILDLGPEELSDNVAREQQLKTLAISKTEDARVLRTSRTASEALAIMDSLTDLMPGLGQLLKTMALRCPKVKLSPLLLGSVTARYSSPAHVLLWCQAVAALHSRTGENPISFDALMVRALGGLLPTDDALAALWQAQRHGPALELNWLDSPEAWTPEALRAAEVARGEGQFVAGSPR